MPCVIMPILNRKKQVHVQVLEGLVGHEPAIMRLNLSEDTNPVVTEPLLSADLQAWSVQCDEPLLLVQGGQGKGEKNHFIPRTMCRANMKPMLLLLRCLGCFPLPSVRKQYHWFVQLLLYLYSLAVVSMMSSIFCFTVWVTNQLRLFSGLLSIDCVSSMINGIKPLHCLLNVLTIAFFAKRHAIALTALDEVEIALSLRKNERFNYSSASRIALSFCLLTFLAPAIARFAQYVLMQESPGDNWISDVSLFLVPMLSVWQFAPLLHFDVCSRTLRHQFRALKLRLMREGLSERSLQHYFERYLLITRASRALDRAFGPFLSASLTISVVVLCLTIYFVVRAHNSLFKLSSDSHMKDLLTDFYFFWSSLQICAAVLYVVLICLSCIKTNEQARSITVPLLRLLPKDKDDRFVLFCFMKQAQLQFIWQLKIFGAIPIERQLLFTVAALIASYTIFLMRFSQPKSCETLGELITQFIARIDGGMEKSVGVETVVNGSA